MKRDTGSISSVWRIGLVGLLSVAIVVAGVAAVLRLWPAPSNPSSLPSPIGVSDQCVPPPTSPPDNGTRTPTPQPSEFGQRPPADVITPTPWPLSRTIDLAPDVPDRDKAFVYVWRCRGTRELFKVNPSEMKGDLASVLSMQTGDVILLYAPPASLMGHQIPPLTAVPSSPTARIPTLAYPGSQALEPPVEYPPPGTASAVAPYPGPMTPTP